MTLFILGLFFLLSCALILLLYPLQQAKKIAIVILILFPLLAGVLYFYWGDSQGVAQYYAKQAQVKVAAKVINKYRQHPEQLVFMLQERLKTNPSDPKGWYLLGRIHASLGHLKKATDAFAKAYQLQPENEKMALQYVQALFYEHHRHLNTEAYRVVNAILKKHPKQTVVLNLLAVNAYLNKQYAKAINYWEELLPLFPPQSESGKVLLQAIAKAQKKLGDIHSSAIVKHNVNVFINITEKTKKLIHKDDVIFVYVKAFDGVPMPLAIKKFTYQNLPKHVLLDDDDSMMPQLKLSRFNKIKVFVHIAKRGTVQVEPGDLLATSHLITLTNTQQSVKVVLSI